MKYMLLMNAPDVLDDPSDIKESMKHMERLVEDLSESGELARRRSHAPRQSHSRYGRSAA